MTARPCPTCAGTGVIQDSNDDAAIAREAAMLRAACADRGIAITPPDLVALSDAARLIGKAAKTLKNWIADDQRLPVRKIGGRTFHSLADLARYRLENSAD